MYPANFEYFAPTTLDEALEILGRYDEGDAKVLAAIETSAGSTRSPKRAGSYVSERSSGTGPASDLTC